MPEHGPSPEQASAPPLTGEQFLSEYTMADFGERDKAVEALHRLGPLQEADLADPALRDHLHEAVTVATTDTSPAEVHKLADDLVRCGVFDRGKGPDPRIPGKRLVPKEVPTDPDFTGELLATVQVHYDRAMLGQELSDALGVAKATLEASPKDDDDKKAYNQTVLNAWVKAQVTDQITADTSRSDWKKYLQRRMAESSVDQAPAARKAFVENISTETERLDDQPNVELINKRAERQFKAQDAQEKAAEAERSAQTQRARKAVEDAAKVAEEATKTTERDQRWEARKTEFLNNEAISYNVWQDYFRLVPEIDARYVPLRAAATTPEQQLDVENRYQAELRETMNKVENSAAIGELRTEVLTRDRETRETNRIFDEFRTKMEAAVTPEQERQLKLAREAAVSEVSARTKAVDAAAAATAREIILANYNGKAIEKYFNRANQPDLDLLAEANHQMFNLEEVPYRTMNRGGWLKRQAKRGPKVVEALIGLRITPIWWLWNDDYAEVVNY